MYQQQEEQDAVVIIPSLISRRKKGKKKKKKKNIRIIIIIINRINNRSSKGQGANRFHNSTVPQNHNRSWLYYGAREMERRREKKKSWFILKLIQHSNKLYIDALRFSSQRLYSVCFFVSCSFFLVSHVLEERVSRRCRCLLFFFYFILFFFREAINILYLIVLNLNCAKHRWVREWERASERRHTCICVAINGKLLNDFKWVIMMKRKRIITRF